MHALRGKTNRKFIIFLSFSIYRFQSFLICGVFGVPHFPVKITPGAKIKSCPVLFTCKMQKKKKLKKNCRATLYTPKVEDTATRMSETWNMRQAQRAVSIDNISFIANAASDERHSTLSKDNVAFSTLNNSHHSHHSNHSTNNFHQYTQKQNNNS